MEAGILLTSHPDPKDEPYPHQAIHARVTREIIEAEELGFDSIWIAEHHFSNKYGILTDPFSYLSYLAAKTSRIKLGAAVMVVPLHHPVRIVENAAFVDILSNGRFQLGLGSGYRPYEFEGLGIDYEKRREIQQEAIPLILDAFTKNACKRMVPILNSTWRKLTKSFRSPFKSHTLHSLWEQVPRNRCSLPPNMVLV